MTEEQTLLLIIYVAVRVKTLMVVMMVHLLLYLDAECDAPPRSIVTVRRYGILLVQSMVLVAAHEIIRLVGRLKVGISVTKTTRMFSQERMSLDRPVVETIVRGANLFFQILNIVLQNVCWIAAVLHPEKWSLKEQLDSV